MVSAEPMESKATPRQSVSSRNRASPASNRAPSSPATAAGVLQTFSGGRRYAEVQLGNGVLVTTGALHNQLPPRRRPASSSWKSQNSRGLPALLVEDASEQSLVHRHFLLDPGPSAGCVWAVQQ